MVCRDFLENVDPQVVRVAMDLQVPPGHQVPPDVAKRPFAIITVHMGGKQTLCLFLLEKVVSDIFI